jgi:molecular chaperone GrpE (heat shock protein)
MRTKSIILGSILVLLGGVTLWWDLSEIQWKQEEIARYQSKYSTETDNFIKQYDEWMRLPADEKSTLPLLLDKDGKTKTTAQLQREQRERLKADLEKLASGRSEVHPFADVLYGENWAKELEAYKKQKELDERVLTGSIVCTSLGGVIYAWWILLWVWQTIVKGVSSLKRLSVNTTEKIEFTEGEQPDTADSGERQPEKKSYLQNRQNEKHAKVPLNSNWGHWKPAQSNPEVKTEAKQIKRISKEAERIDSLLSDEKAARVAALKAKPLDARDHPKPLDNTLKQLSQEVSAIREYTSYQQDRLEKLQDGYDWNIIRTFCLRVIRCIDNLDNRISQLNSRSRKVNHLTEVRDELVFALDSSGVEQFEPEINSDYRGQEKIAEAVKDRQDSEEPEQKGKIASVIRPGYQYFISEENIKVVRPAQVKLFA